MACFMHLLYNLLLLIQLYEKEKLLWDPRNELYFNRNEKQDAWRRISEVIGEEMEDSKKKINSLLGTFRREKSREKNSLITGSATDSRYVSKWYAYEYFYFMSDKYDPHGNLDTIPRPTESQESLSQTLEDVTQTSLNDSSPSQPPQNIQSQPPSQPPQNIQPRRGYKRTAADPMLNEAMGILRESSKQRSDDPLISYGLHIANELRKYDNITLANVKHAINNILYQAEIGYYSYNPFQQYGYNNNYNSTASSSLCSSRSRSVSRDSNYNVQSPASLPISTPPPPPPPPPPPKSPHEDNDYED